MRSYSASCTLIRLCGNFCFNSRPAFSASTKIPYGRGQATNNDGSSRGTNNDGRSCRGSHSNSWGSHRSSHSHRSGGSSHRSSHDGRLADSKPFVAQARERLRLVCFRLLALPRHRISRQVQCQPRRVPPECIVSFLHTPSTAGCVAKPHSLARHGIDAGQTPFTDARRVQTARVDPPVACAVSYPYWLRVTARR